MNGLLVDVPDIVWKSVAGRQGRVKIIQTKEELTFFVTYTGSD